ncbi:N-acetylmuramoyl-L-alanine amidase [Streptosporangium soli]|nr:N-acetylmuramoyl-L-alanine amidase [Streptosporangium sp. KLBMP 9127]
MRLWVAAALPMLVSASTAVPGPAALPPLASASTAVPPGPAAGARLAAYAEAARAYGVPESVLLAVSYLHSRWDTHAGRPSTSGGFGPMHLIDARAVTTGPAHAHGSPDRRGDDSRPALRPRAAHHVPAATVDTVRQAARLTGLGVATLRSDPAANIRGGAALLADRQRRLGRPLPAEPADWYDAVAAYASDGFAREVYATIRSGAARTTDDGQAVRLAPTSVPLRPAERRAPAGRAECPATVSCQWMPGAYRKTGNGGYGNHDRMNTPRKIDYIIIHDGETSYDAMTKLSRNPRYVSWHYTLRSRDGQIAQHVRNRDIAWHCGNWYFNSRSIGLEHEGYLARGGAWYTEAMYRSSAALVRHLAGKHGIPLDRAHILGHDNVPGVSPATVAGMHDDPGPYWDWAHYFELLGAPLGGAAPRDDSAPVADPADPSWDAGSPAGEPEWDGVPPPTLDLLSDPSSDPSSGLPAEIGGDEPWRAVRRVARTSPASVVILPDYQTHRPYFTGCVAGKPGKACPAAGAASVWLHTAPRNDAPLVRDIGKHPGSGSTRSVYDHAARASTGQRYAVAGRSGDWTAIWYLGHPAWFHNPASAPTAEPYATKVVTPRRASVPLYGRAYPGRAAYPRRVPFQKLVPLQYRLRAGQSYTVGLTVRSSYLRAGSFNPARHVAVQGRLTYHQIQFGHRVMFVKAADVRQTTS